MCAGVAGDLAVEPRPTLWQTLGPCNKLQPLIFLSRKIVFNQLVKEDLFSYFHLGSGFYLSGSGEIGIRAGFRFQCRKV
jgi:hypothetical protein